MDGQTRNCRRVSPVMEDYWTWDRDEVHVWTFARSGVEFNGGGLQHRTCTACACSLFLLVDIPRIGPIVMDRDTIKE